MSKPKLRKSIVKSVKIDARDKAAVDEAVIRWDWTSEADIIRTALRVGLKSLARDPSPLGEPPVPPDYIKAPPGLMEAPRMEAMEMPPDAPGTTAARTASGLDTLGSKQSLSGVVEELRELRDAKAEREGKKPKGGKP